MITLEMKMHCFAEECEVWGEKVVNSCSEYRGVNYWKGGKYWH